MSIETATAVAAVVVDLNPSETPSTQSDDDSSNVKLEQVEEEENEAEECCKKISFTDFSKLRGGEKSYEDAVREAAKFNSSLDKDRRRRLPFLESHTRVNQVPNMSLNLLSYQRRYITTPSDIRSLSGGNVIVYPTKKWFKSKRFLTDKMVHYHHHHHHQSYQMHKSLSNPDNQIQQEASSGESATNVTHSMNRSFSLSTNTSSVPSSSSPATLGLLGHLNAPTSSSSLSLSASFRSVSIPKSPQQQQQVSAVNKDEHAEWQLLQDVAENLMDDVDSDGSDYDDKKKRRKKAKRVKLEGMTTTTAASSEDKPYVCEKCNARYKTKPGLSYHLQKVHPTSSPSHGSGGGGGSNSQSSLLMEQHRLFKVKESRLLASRAATSSSTFADSTSYDEIINQM